MNFNEAVVSGFHRYFDFQTRSSRSEYWWWFLFAIIVSIGSTILDELLFGGMVIIDLISSLALLIPGIAVSVRRLHDVNRSGWWILSAFTVIGMIFPLFYWSVLRGDQGTNKFGPDPLQPRYQTQPQPQSIWQGATIQRTPVSEGMGQSSRGDSPTYCYQCGVGIASQSEFCVSCGADFR